MADETSRKDDLRTLRDGLIERMGSCESDQNFAVMGRLLKDVIKELDEVSAPAEPSKPEGSVLSEFEAKLAQRKSGAPSARRAKGG